MIFFFFFRATNPSQFEIEFFVNDLSKPGASTFESLGGLEYKQNVHIQLECERKQIPTDGLVLRGWYTTITLAVYGSLTKSLISPPELPTPAPPTPVPITVPSEPAVAVNPPEPCETQPEWFYENQTQGHAASPAETCLVPTPSPTIQPIPTVEASQKTTSDQVPPEASTWPEEVLEPPVTPVKRPSPPPSESLISLSPESISAEEEEGEKEPEEPSAVEAVEPFEPILSDEELMTDDLPVSSLEFQCDILPDDLHVIKPPELLDIMEIPNVREDRSSIENRNKIREIFRCLTKSVINFHNVTGQEKETFVHNCETLCVLLASFSQLQHEDLKELGEIVNAGLDMELARAQPQPAYKLRHVKVGVRLAEAACSLHEGSTLLLQVNAPQKLLKLCTQENVALPVKLAALRALDSALMNPKIVEKFLNSDNNLYKCTLIMLNEAKLARLKYALASLLRKIHVHELLANTDCSINEMTCIELTQAYNCAPTLMAQPRRQLPASMQMEFEREGGRNPRRHLIYYFEHHGLLRRLLLALVSSDSSKGLIRATRRLLLHLSDTGEGLQYLLHDPEVTKSLLKALRYGQPGLGSQIAWKLQVVQCLLQLQNQLIVDWQTIKKLHSFLTYPEGMKAVVAVVPMNCFIDILIPLLSQRDLSEFAAEIIAVVIRYSDRVQILQLRAAKLLQETRNAGILRDVMPHLNVAAVPGNWNYGDVSSLVGIIRKNAEKASSLPGELITACRILHYLIFPSHDSDPTEVYVELKHRNALTAAFAADGLTALVAVMMHLTVFYEQPFLNRAALTGRRGLALIGLLRPCVNITRALLERLVKCMATAFKDLTPVVPLLGVYALVDCIPSHDKCTRILADDIAETLLLFTQAVDSDSAGNVAKSLWTQMLGEVLKMISASPCNFVPGLKLFARLLPPILYLDDSAPQDLTRALGLRKLWSAHLQAQAASLTETLRLLAASWNVTLLSLLSRVCKQLSDLAAPTALLVGRCLLDRILAAPLENNRPTLALLGDLAYHASVKATLLTLLNPTSRAQVKSDQKYLPVVEMMCTALKNSEVSLEILDIFHTLCDHTLSIVQEESGESFEFILAHSVPSKEPLLSIIAALIDILANSVKYSHIILEGSLRILLSLTVHNYGLYHVKSCLENNLGSLKAFIEHVATLVEKEGDNEEKMYPLMTLTVTFLESLVTCEKSEKRSLYLRLSQLATLIIWDKNNSHPLEKIRGTQDLINDLKAIMGDGKEDKEPISEMLEPLLPTCETLLIQFSRRSVKKLRLSPLHTRKRTLGSTGVTLDINSVDLMALATELLPADFNLLTATQLVCSKAPKDNILEPVQVKGQVDGTGRGRDNVKTPNVPTAKTKQPFVTPMRGRAQFVNSRGGISAGGVGRGADPFRSRPPNTSRPPSLHVDDFVALETCGAQPTGPTGYNKLSVRGTCPPRGVISGPRCRSWVSEPRPPYLR